MSPDDTESRALRFRELPLSIAPMRLNRNLLWPAAALLFAAAVLPFLVYYTGTQTLGPYSNGGPLQFVADFYASLAHFRGAAWTLLLGPAALVVFWRILVVSAWPRKAQGARERREPRLTPLKSDETH
jgi:hypothetical protein